METNSNYIQIESKIDCLQNLLIMLCRQNNLNVEALYFLWPWEFICKSSSAGTLSIDLTDVVDAEKLYDYFRVEFKQFFFKNAKELLKRVDTLIRTGRSVIVSTDQYYIPYHYQHIYGFEHGLHSVLLTGINQNDNVFCVSSIPEFTGPIEYSKIKQAILSDSIKHWYATTSFDNCQPITMQEAWVKYQNKLKKIIEKDYKTPICYTNEIYQFLNSIWDLSETELKDKLISICSGTWGWQISRRGTCLSKLMSTYAYHAEESIRKIIQSVEEINQKWELAFKLLFMQSQTGKINKRPLTILKQVVKIERTLAYQLLELPEFYFVEQEGDNSCLR